MMKTCNKLDQTGSQLHVGYGLVCKNILTTECDYKTTTLLNTCTVLNKY